MNSETISDDQWEEIFCHLRQLCDPNKSFLPLDSRQTISYQLERGFSVPSSRLHAWHHITLEIQLNSKTHKNDHVNELLINARNRIPRSLLKEVWECNLEEADIQNRNADIESPSKQSCEQKSYEEIIGISDKISHHPENVQMTDMQEPVKLSSKEKIERCKYAEDRAESSPRVFPKPPNIKNKPKSHLKVDTKRNMPMLERQEEWLEKKAMKAAAQIEAARAKDESLVFVPDTRLSRRSYEQTAAIRSLSKATKSFQRKISTPSAPLGDATNFSRRNSTSKRKRSKKIKNIGKNANNADISLNPFPNKEKKELQSDSDGILKENIEQLCFNSNEEQYNPSIVSAEKEQENNNNASNSVDDFEQKEQTNSFRGNGEPIESNKIFSNIDEENCTKSIRVRNCDDFEVASMYRKRDKMSGLGGAVSLLVGQTEAPPHDEKVAEVVFDMDAITEKKALEWWKENRHRFET